MNIGVLRFRVIGALIELQGELRDNRNAYRIAKRLTAENRDSRKADPPMERSVPDDQKDEVLYTSVLRALQLLEGQGLVDSEEDQPRGRPVSYYSINSLGRTRFCTDCKDLRRDIPFLQRCLDLASKLCKGS